MSKRILVIDDESAIRRSFEMALEDTDFIVDTAESGERAVELVNENKYDLIYTDMKMPGMNGAETIEKIRETEKDIPIYVVTAFHTEFFAQLASARANGISFDLLQKPIGSDQILEVTLAVLGGSGGD